VVIGAGVGGLSAAARLAAAGHQVTLFERAATGGGKLGRYSRHTPAGQFRFDTGPSLVTLPQMITELAGATGGEFGLDLVELDPIVRHRFADGRVLDSCADPAGFADRIGVALNPQAAEDWVRLWARAERVWHTSWAHVLTRPVGSGRLGAGLDLARLAWRIRDLAAIAPGRTLRDLGRRYLRDPRLRVLLDRYATYAGADPRRAPAALVAIPFAELRHGGWYPRGGLGTIADALLTRCADLGVRLEFGTEVVGITTAGGRVSGVQLADGTWVRADLVVANADVRRVHERLLPAAATRPPEPSAQSSLAGFVLLLGLRGATPGLAHHTVYFPADYDAEFDAIFGPPGRRTPTGADGAPRGWAARPVPDPTIFITRPVDPAVHPAGHEAWFVLVNAPPQGRAPTGVDWTAPGFAQQYADQVLATLAGRGLDVRDRVLFRQVRTPADLAAATDSPGGAIYGAAPHGLRGLRRPANRTRLPGLFLVGGSVHPGGGLPLVMLSAKLVADLIGPPG